MLHRSFWIGCVVALLAPAAAYAQPAAAPPAATQPSLTRISFGAKLGMNYSWLTSDDEFAQEILDPKAGVAIGGFVSVPLTPLVSVQPELLFSMKGVAVNFGGESGDISLNYLSIPILARLNIPTSGQVHPYAVLGPVVNVLMTAETSADGQSEDLKDQTNGVDMGLMIGGGAALKLSPTSPGMVTLEARVELGLSLVPTEEEADGDSVHNRVVSVLVGYQF